MLCDARSIRKNKTLHYDLCIVGAGTAGITLAKSLMGENLKICLVESGDLKPDKETQSLSYGENIGKPYFTLETARTRAFGGCCNRWDIPLPDDSLGLRLRPFDEIDFEERPGIPHSGWPFSKEELDPFYDRAQVFCGVDPVSYSAEDWSDPAARPLISFHDDTVETVLFKFGSRDPFLRRYGDEIVGAADVVTCLNANVTDIELDPPGKQVKKLRVECLNGNTFWIRSRRYVLAAGGIETPRIMLSANRVQNCGVGNRHDLVGRFFMEHLHFRSGFVFPSDPAALDALAFYTSMHLVNNVPVMGKLALNQDVLRAKGLLNGSFQLLPRVFPKKALPLSVQGRKTEPPVEAKSVTSAKLIRDSIKKGRLPADSRRYLQDVMAGIDDLAVLFFSRYKNRITQAVDKRKVWLLQLAHMTEQVPNPESRITLSSDRDALGQPRLKLNWQWTDFDIQSSVESQRILKEALSASRVGDLVIQLDREKPPGGIRGGWHHMGTTRMHRDPRKGVVDADSRVHGLSNLYIAGPSVFPTVGQANPVLTIVALTIRLAEHLKARFRESGA